MTRLPRIPVLLLLLALLPPASAQIAPARIASLSPVGGQRGTTVEVTISGTHIGRGTALLIEGEGIAVEAVTPEPPPPVKEGEKPPDPPLNPEGKLTARLRIAADAEPGIRGLRVITPAGPSDVARFAVGQWPEVAEREPNNTPAEAQPMTFPVCVTGRVDPEKSDYFRFQGRAGQTLVFDLLASRLGSPMDAILTLLDASGRKVALNDDANGMDPLLIVTLPANGEYLLQVRDLLYRGGDRYHYRLTMGEIPYVTAAFPPGGRAGETVELQLAGVNLGGASSARVTLPAEVPPEPFTRALPLPTGVSNPILLSVDEPPEILATEGQAVTRTDHRPPTTDHDPATIREIPVPATVSGRLLAGDGAASKGDCYRFRAEKGARLLLEVMARRLGSEMDSVLTVLDATGKELASNDDAEGKDSRIEFTAPESGEYLVCVRDLHDRQGPGAFYRLRVVAGPDFRLTFTPDRLWVGRGGRVPLAVRATRFNGFDGEIALEVSGLPEGVRLLGPARIRAGRGAAHLILAALPDAPLEGAPLRVVGTATVAGQTLRREAQGQEPVGPEDNRRYRSVPLAVAAAAEPPDVVVSASPESVALAPGGSVEISVTVARRPGFDRNLPLLFLDLPPGVSAETPEVPKDKGEVKVTLKAEGSAVPIEADLALAGKITLDAERQTYHAAPPIRLVVEKKP